MTESRQKLIHANDSLEYFLDLVLNCYDGSIKNDFSSGYMQIDDNYDKEMMTIISGTQEKLRELTQEFGKHLKCGKKVADDLMQADSAGFQFLLLSRLSGLSFACENVNSSKCGENIKDETKKTLFRFMADIVGEISSDAISRTCKREIQKISEEKFIENSFQQQENSFKTVKDQCLNKLMKEYEEWSNSSSSRDCRSAHGKKCLGWRKYLIKKSNCCLKETIIYLHQFSSYKALYFRLYFLAIFHLQVR